MTGIHSMDNPFAGPGFFWLIYYLCVTKPGDMANLPLNDKGEQTHFVGQE